MVEVDDTAEPQRELAGAELASGSISATRYPPHLHLPGGVSHFQMGRIIGEPGAGSHWTPPTENGSGSAVDLPALVWRGAVSRCD